MASMGLVAGSIGEDIMKAILMFVFAMFLVIGGLSARVNKSAQSVAIVAGIVLFVVAAVVAKKDEDDASAQGCDYR